LNFEVHGFFSILLNNDTSAKQRSAVKLLIIKRYFMVQQAPII